MDKKIPKEQVKSKIIDLIGWGLILIVIATIFLIARGLLIGDLFIFVYIFIFSGVNFSALLLVRLGELDKKDRSTYISGAVGGIFIGMLFYYIYTLNLSWGIK